MKSVQQETIEAIEPLLDRSSLSDIVLALARLCNEKAEHVRSAWQDEHLAKAWDRAARACDRFSQHAGVLLAGK